MHNSCPTAAEFAAFTLDFFLRMPMRLVIGNKLYSSWSLRPWLLMQALGLPFEEQVIPLYKDGSKARILEASPSGKVPCLIDGGTTVWESLAIVEYLAERFPDKGIWPADTNARAHARAISSEMHAGFQPLRAACPMNLGKRFAPRDFGPDVSASVARIEAIWCEARAAFGSHRKGPFLYGPFTAADAMYAPVVTRLDTYQVTVSADTRAYMEAILHHPAFLQWRAEALAEPAAWDLPHYEEGHVAVEHFRRPDK
jgi:glutathione S-transferase